MIAAQTLFTEPAAIAARAERASSAHEALAILREMSLDEFGLLLLAPQAYPGLMPWLPAMATDEIQLRWTGASGYALLSRSVSFMRVLENLHARLRNRSLAGRTFLDYGCGWGRLMRLALYYSDPDALFGVDAWDLSLGFCGEARVPGTILKIDPAPESLSLPTPIDVAYAVSVFTHLPRKTMCSALRAIRTAMAPDGLLVFTFRPVEFWDVQQAYWDLHPTIARKSREELRNEHFTEGFAFQPGGEANAIWGDASISHAMIDALLNECGWRRLVFDHTIVDPHQSIVAAEPLPV